MANGYRKACVPGSLTTLADMQTLTGGPGIIIHNNGNGTIAVGGADLTFTTGFTLDIGSVLACVIDGSEVIYGITSTTTLTAQVFRTNTPNTPFH